MRMDANRFAAVGRASRNRSVSQSTADSWRTTTTTKKRRRAKQRWPAVAKWPEFWIEWRRLPTDRNIATIRTSRTGGILPDMANCSFVDGRDVSAGRNRDRRHVGRRHGCNGLPAGACRRRKTSNCRRPSTRPDTDPTAEAANWKSADEAIPFAVRPNRLVPPSAEPDKVGCPVVEVRWRSESVSVFPDANTASIPTRTTERSLRSTGPCTTLVPKEVECCWNIHRHQQSPNSTHEQKQKEINECDQRNNI